jgi:hypothetical protein
MPRIHLLVSFDHELSLGGVTSSYSKNLFAPTRQVLDVADAAEVPVTLFTDVLCGVRFREWEIDGSAEGFSEEYETQLRDALHRGHDVQLHLHPHWLDTDFEGGRFHPSTTSYSLHDFRNRTAPDNIDGIVARGVDYIESVCGTASHDYDCVAFRAGGFNIAPSTDETLRALTKQGIRIDSSVARNYRFESQINTVDFSRVPVTSNWCVAPGTPINQACPEGTEGALFEVPIVSVPRNPINNLPALALRLLRSSRCPEATGLPLYDVDASAFDKLKRLFPSSSWMLSFDLHWASGKHLVRILERYLAYFDPDEEIWASTISHPKSMGSGGVRLMQEFLVEAKKRFGDELEFCDFKTIAHRLHSS